MQRWLNDTCCEPLKLSFCWYTKFGLLSKWSFIFFRVLANPAWDRSRLIFRPECFSLAFSFSSFLFFPTIHESLLSSFFLSVQSSEYELVNALAFPLCSSIFNLFDRVFMAWRSQQLSPVNWCPVDFTDGQLNFAWDIHPGWKNENKFCDLSQETSFKGKGSRRQRKRITFRSRWNFSRHFHDLCKIWDV